MLLQLCLADLAEQALFDLANALLCIEHEGLHILSSLE